MTDIRTRSGRLPRFELTGSVGIEEPEPTKHREGAYGDELTWEGGEIEGMQGLEN